MIFFPVKYHSIKKMLTEPFERTSCFISVCATIIKQKLRFVPSNKYIALIN